MDDLRPTVAQPAIASPNAGLSTAAMTGVGGIPTNGDGENRRGRIERSTESDATLSASQQSSDCCGETPARLPACNSANPAPETSASVNSVEDVNATGSPKGPAVNRQAALLRLGDDEELFAELVQLFGEDAPVLLNEAQAAARAGEIELMVRRAHSLKGLCANFDAADAVSAAQIVENTGLAGAVPPKEAFLRLTAEVERVFEALGLPIRS